METAIRVIQQLCLSTWGSGERHTDIMGISGKKSERQGWGVPEAPQLAEKGSDCLVQTGSPVEINSTCEKSFKNEELSRQRSVKGLKKESCHFPQCWSWTEVQV